MLEFTTPTGELEAVNTLLATLGEAPVSGLEGPRTADVALALNTLRESSREVQSEGWAVNSEAGFILAPDVEGHIAAPENLLTILTEERPRRRVAVRGGRLYDLEAHSFRFTGPVRATVVLLLPFADLTERLRRYITLRAARLFQDRALGSGQAHADLEKDEYLARVRAVQENSDLEQANVMTGPGGFLSGWEVADVLRR